jgi:hypothetical protein
MWHGTRVYPNFQLTPWNIMFLERLIIAYLVKKFHAFYGTKAYVCVH